MIRKKTRLLIVDDSAYQRINISKNLSTDPEIEIIDTASNGIEAIEKIKQLSPDVVTLDVEMPKMDGLTALRHIMSECPTPVVMLSTLTAEGTAETIKALELGAVDFFPKPSAINPTGTNESAEELRSKVKLAANVDAKKLKSSPHPPPPTQPNIPPSQTTRKVLLIGCSTGGPQALNDIVPFIPPDIQAPILIVQHMPPVFTKQLADRLDNISQVTVKEAQQNDIMKPGSAFLAPGDYHMTVDQKGKISLNQNERERGLRPAVNITMESVAKFFGTISVCVILTGMGDDGARGAALIKAAKGTIIVEDESTCVVYGMPKAIVDAGYADKILPRQQIVNEIVLTCNN